MRRSSASVLGGCGRRGTTLKRHRVSPEMVATTRAAPPPAGAVEGDDVEEPGAEDIVDELE
jgi:hypothetical protein